MTTPPQGPWGPGQPGGQPGGQHGGQGQPPQQGGWGQQPPAQGGGGWGQRPQQPQQPQQPQRQDGPGQPQQGQPQQGQPQQGQQGQPQQGGWGQQQQQGGWGQQQGQQYGGQGGQQGGWGQRSGQQGGSYQQQSWGQHSQQQGGWQQQGGQPQWQGGPGGPGGSKGPGGISKDKLPLVIGGGVVGIVLIGLLVFLGIHAFGGDDEPASSPTGGQQPTSEPSTTGSGGGGGENGQLGNATGQAKTVTEKLQGSGFGCSDLFNTGQGAHRGCFKYDGSGEAQAVFQFQPDGSVLGVKITSKNQDNINNAAVVFDQALQAIGNDAFGGSEVKKIQDAIKNGQKSQKIGTSWGEFQLRNSGDSVELSGGKSGADPLEIPQKTFDTTAAQLTAALKGKQYVCTSSCTKKIGKSGQQRVYFYASEGEGIKVLEMSAYGDSADVKKSFSTSVTDAFGVVKGGDVAALKTYIQAHSDGKSHAAYVSGWRVEMTGEDDGDFASQQIEIQYESFYF